ncbi:MAG: hypothetical protein LBK07_00090 [Tannerella sp.]|jgi:hypothetical protein|nr:hypothetical protein [Tannerella sp.]
MVFQNPKIKYYRIRTFGERLNVSFDYLRETWKPMLKFSLYLILPICLIQAFAINAVMRSALIFGVAESGRSLATFAATYGVYFLCLLFGSALLSALVYALMQAYEQRETRLTDIRWADFKPLLIRNFKKALGLSLLAFGVVLVYGLLAGVMAALAPWSLFFTILLLLVATIVLIVPFTIMLPLYIFEDIPLTHAVRRAFSFGFEAWGGTFLVIFIFGLLANIISSVTMMPWYIVTLVGSILGISGAGGIESQLWYMFLIYVLGIIQSYGLYVSSIITAVGYAFQYFHLREKREGVSVQDSILNFDKL